MTRIVSEKISAASKRSKTKNEKGFTLVELALSLTIIGLLLAGIMKGEELYENTQVLSVARDFTAYSAATNSFRDAYNALPGDIHDPADRVPDCLTAPCNVGGDADGFISPTSPAATGLWFECAITGEKRNFWLHLARANLITSVDRAGGTSGTYATTAFRWGVELPGSSVTDAGFCADSTTLSAPLTPMVTNMIGIVQTGVEGSAPLKVRQAYNLDKKLDDGMPLTGRMVMVDEDNCYDNGAPTSQTPFALDSATAMCQAALLLQ